MKVFLAQLLPSLQSITNAFTWRDGVDILIVALFLYLVLLLFKRTHSFFIVDGIVILFIAYIGARFFNFYLTSILLQYFFGFFILIMVIIFRDELRSFFESISFWGRVRRPIESEKRGEDKIVDSIKKSLDYLSHHKIGALIVFPGKQPLDRLLQGGVKLNGELSIPLLLSLFDPNSPGHDGAVLIEGDYVRRFGTHLPLAEKYQHLREVGTRHRAAVGLSEKSDALIFIVSEERGTISIAHFGVLTVLNTIEEVETRLRDFFNEILLFRNPKSWIKGFFQNIPEKLLVIVLAIGLWLTLVFQLGNITKEFEVPVEFRFLASDEQVIKVSPPAVTVTVSGRSSDFELIDIKNLRVIVDASSFEPGLERVKLDEKMVQVPRNLTLINFSPNTIRFEVEEKGGEEKSLLQGT